jgi:DNA-binding HxlR family transcriptional regulator
VLGVASREQRSKTYGEFCGVARALDLVGDRWTLLIVRELLVGPARYAELQARLPGIATNLLAARLRDLEVRGIVERDDQARWGAAYTLTEFGRGLEDVLAALVRWSTPLMAHGRADDEFRPSWLVVALRALLAPVRGSRRTVQLVVEGESVSVTTGGPRLDVRLGSDGASDATLEAPAEMMLGLAAGALTFDDVTTRQGVHVTGSRAALQALFARRRG